jgi:predicted GIY-YIG superfamily endonuclease
MEKLDAENSKFNLISLYFSVSFTTEEVVLSNAKSREFYLKYLDLAERIKKHRKKPGKNYTRNMLLQCLKCARNMKKYISA